MTHQETDDFVELPQEGQTSLLEEMRAHLGIQMKGRRRMGLETATSGGSDTTRSNSAARSRAGLWGILALALSLVASVFVGSGNALAAYSTGLDTPAIPLASDTFTWTIGGSSDSPLRSVSLTGCWNAEQVASVTASSGRVLVNNRTGAITVSNGRGLSTPLTVTARYIGEYQSRSGVTTLVYSERSGRTSAQVDGPNCQPPAAPDAPGSVAATQHNDSTELSWSEPFNNGGTITGYTVSCDPACPSTASGLATSGATSTSVSGLTYGQSYTFSVTATNKYGTGAPSPASNAVVFAAAPGAPHSLSATGLSGKAYIYWQPAADNGSAITAYNVRVYAPGTDTPVSDMTVDPSKCGTSCSAAVGGLTDGTTYSYTVGATNAYGAGPLSSNTVTVVGPPGVPDIFYALPGDGYVEMSWSATTNGGAPILHYNVTRYSCSSTPLVTCAPPTFDFHGELNELQSPGWRQDQTRKLEVTAYKWSALTNGDKYVFTIRAANADFVSKPAITNVIMPYAGAGGCKVRGGYLC